MEIGFSPVFFAERNLVLMTFCCLCHILWLFWELSLERPKSFCLPVCLKFRCLDSTFLIRASIAFCIHELTFFFFSGKLYSCRTLEYMLFFKREIFLETVLPVWHATWLSNAFLRLQTAWENVVPRSKCSLVSVDRW